VAKPEAFFDTNVLVYAFDESAPDKMRCAQGLTERYSPVLSAQVLGEFYVVVTRKLARPLSSSDAATAVQLLSAFPVLSITDALVAGAIETATRHQLSYWDGLIVEAAARSNCSVLLTEDLAAGSTLRGVTIENPFAGL
jgi:predicted nucleic acid-binding protein